MVSAKPLPVTVKPSVWLARLMVTPAAAVAAEIRLHVDDLRIRGAVERRRRRGQHDGVGAGPAVDRVGPHEAVDGVVAAAGIDDVGAGAAR